MHYLYMGSSRVHWILGPKSRYKKDISPFYKINRMTDQPTGEHEDFKKVRNTLLTTSLTKKKSKFFFS